MESGSLAVSSDLSFVTRLLTCREQTASDFLPPCNSPSVKHLPLLPVKSVKLLNCFFHPNRNCSHFGLYSAVNSQLTFENIVQMNSSFQKDLAAARLCPEQC